MNTISLTRTLLASALAFSWSFTDVVHPVWAQHDRPTSRVDADAIGPASSTKPLFQLLHWATHAVEADGLGLAGSYACEGTNPEGRRYRAILEVMETGQTWHLRWSFPGSDALVFGIGLRHDDRLVVGTAADGSLGVVTYTAKEGKWEGRWTLAGSREVYAERHCLPGSSCSPVLNRDVSGIHFSA